MNAYTTVFRLLHRTNLKMIFQGFLLLLALRETIEIPNETPQYLQFKKDNCCTYSLHSELTNPTRSRLQNYLEESAMHNTLHNLKKIEFLADKPIILNGNGKHFDVLTLSNSIQPHSSSRSPQSVTSKSKHKDNLHDNPNICSYHSCVIPFQHENMSIFNQTCNEMCSEYLNHVSNLAFDATNLQVSQLSNRFGSEETHDVGNGGVKKTDQLSLAGTFKDGRFESNVDYPSKSSKVSKYHISELEIMFRIAIFLMLFVAVFLFNIYFCGSIVYCVYKKGFVPLDG